CISILLVKDVAIDFYKVADETKEIARQLMSVLAFIGIFISIAAISIVGILRGGGDAKFAFWSEAMALWGVGVPLALLSAFVFKLPVAVVFLCMKIDEPVKVIMCMARLKGVNWIKIVTRDDVIIDE
ncbi:MAG: MATE family efflux transporter, partial [Oscillospiraceae bacterium]